MSSNVQPEATTGQPAAPIRFVIWDRKLRQPVGQPFLTREAARAVINRDFGGDLRLYVRRVIGGAS